MGREAEGDGVAHPGVLHGLDTGGQVTDFAGSELVAGGQAGGAHVAYFYQGELSAGGHQADGVARLDRAFKHTDIDDDALVAVVDAVKDQRFQGGIRVAGGGGDVGDHPLQHLVDVQAGLGRDPGRIQAGQTDHIFDLLGDLLRVGAGQVDLVQDGYQLQVVLQSHVGVGQGLGFHALGGVHYQDSALTGGQAAGDLVGKVHMARVSIRLKS